MFVYLLLRNLPRNILAFLTRNLLRNLDDKRENKLIYSRKVVGSNPSAGKIFFLVKSPLNVLA